MANFNTIDDFDVNGKTVLVRIDINSPVDPNSGIILDDTRMKLHAETIKELSMKGAKTVILAHQSRPGKDDFTTLEQHAVVLSKAIGLEVKYVDSIFSSKARESIIALEPGQILLLENVRFHREETDNDPEFSKKLASFAEIFVNDAFGTAHRAHASTAGVADYLPAVSGFLIEKELNFMGDALNNPERPFMAILGGRKVSDKIGVIEALLEKVDVLMIGGAMAYTFFKSMGYNVGNSICELDKLDLAKELMAKAEAKGVKLMLPVDTRIGKEFKADTESKVVDSRNSDENNSIRRRRECLKCGKRFTTYETIETTPILVIKSDNSRQSFNSDKIRRGIVRACEKRPVSMAQIDEIVSDIEKEISNSLDQEIKTSKIGELVMSRLKNIDDVAYIRFASVYRKFTDTTHFVDFIKEFENLISQEKEAK